MFIMRTGFVAAKLLLPTRYSMIATARHSYSPIVKPTAPRGIYDRTTRGLRIYLATPRLRGLLAISLAVAAGGALVIVNTVVFVQGRFGLAQSDTALALAAFGAGSMMVALLLPCLLERLSDRPVMLAGTGLLIAGTALSALIDAYFWLLPLWFMMGAGYSLAQTPSGRLLRRSASAEDRPALFAAQFALSHACWLLTYPFAGWAGAAFGLPAVSLLLAAIAGGGMLIALKVWSAIDPEAIAHRHPDLPEDHPHRIAHRANPAGQHVHVFVVDDLHPAWPGLR